MKERLFTVWALLLVLFMLVMEGKNHVSGKGAIISCYVVAGIVVYWLWRLPQMKFKRKLSLAEKVMQGKVKVVHEHDKRTTFDYLREINYMTRTEKLLLFETLRIDLQLSRPKIPREGSYIPLNPAEIMSGSTRVKAAEGLISQLPPEHEGRNSWLLNYGIGAEAKQFRDGKNLDWDKDTQSAKTTNTKTENNNDKKES